MSDESTELTVYDAIIKLANPTCEIASQLNSFLVTKLGNNPFEFISDIITMLFNESIPDNNYLYLLVHLANAISTRLRPVRTFSNNWQKIMSIVAKNLDLSDDQTQLKEIVDNFHSRLITFLNDEKIEVRQNASLCVSRLYYIEYMIDLWDDFFPSLFSTIKDSTSNINIIDSSFRILIQLIKMQIISKEIDNFDLIILNIYEVIKLYLSNPSIDVNIRILCLKMNSKAHYMLDQFLTQEDEMKGYINYLLLHLRDIPDKTVHRLAYKLLKKTFARHIENMLDLMEMIFPIVCADLEKNDAGNKALAIDFWIGLAIAEKDKNLHTIIAASAPSLVPVFLQFLISNTDTDLNRSSIYNDRDIEDEIEVDVETNENNLVIVNSILCLRLFVEAEPDIVPPLIIPFITENFASENQLLNIASLNASYSVFKNKNFFSFIVEMMPRLLTMATQEENSELQSCALFILSESLSNYPQLIGDADCFNQLVSLVEKSISFATNPNSIKITQNKKNKILYKDFNLLSKIIKCFSDDPEMKSFLGENYDRIWSIFQHVFDNYPIYREELFLIRIIFSTLDKFIRSLPNELEDKIIQILSIAHKNIVNEMEDCQSNPALFLSVNCSIICTVGYKIRNKIEPFVSDIMETIIRLFSQFDEEVFTEALQVIEEFQLIFKDEFHVYQERLIEIVGNILSIYEQINHRLIKQSIRVISMMFEFPSFELKQKVEDLYNLISPIFKNIYEKAPYHPHQKQLNLGIGSIVCSERMPRDILPCAIKAIALIVSNSSSDRRDKFIDQYSNLNKAQKIQIDVSQNDDIDFAYDLYEKILFAYKILIKILDGEYIYLIMKNIDQMLMAFENIYKYCVATTKCLDYFISIIYHLVNIFKDKFCENLNTPKYEVITKILDFIKDSPDEVFKKKATILINEINKWV